jgi:hypothetical protein
LYEFIEEGMRDDPANLLTRGELQPGKQYSMIVSDPFGLRRYQTGDLFYCRRLVNRLPELVFTGRKDLEYSFTGEKLTAEHVSAAFQTLRQEYRSLRTEPFLTCLPAHLENGARPHYKLVLVEQSNCAEGVPGGELAQRFDELLQIINCEYRSKRESGRLGAPSFVRVSLVDFVSRVAGIRDSRTWESQFKLLPLYKKVWV